MKRCHLLTSAGVFDQIRYASEAREHLLPGAPGEVSQGVARLDLSRHQLLLGRSRTAEQRRPRDVHAQRGHPVVSTADVCVKSERRKGVLEMLSGKK